MPSELVKSMTQLPLDENLTQNLIAFHIDSPRPGATTALLKWYTRLRPGGASHRPFPPPRSPSLPCLMSTHATGSSDNPRHRCLSVEEIRVWLPNLPQTWPWELQGWGRAAQCPCLAAWPQRGGDVGVRGAGKKPSVCQPCPQGRRGA